MALRGEPPFQVWVYTRPPRSPPVPLLPPLPRVPLTPLQPPAARRRPHKPGRPHPGACSRTGSVCQGHPSRYLLANAPPPSGPPSDGSTLPWVGAAESTARPALLQFCVWALPPGLCVPRVGVSVCFVHRCAPIRKTAPGTEQSRKQPSSLNRSLAGAERAPHAAVPFRVWRTLCTGSEAEGQGRGGEGRARGHGVSTRAAAASEAGGGPGHRLCSPAMRPDLTGAVSISEYQ